MSFADKLKKRYEETLTYLSNTALVPDHIAEERMNICKACPNLTEWNRCSECGCFMTLKTKLAVASCPLPEKKWDIYAD